MPRESRIPLEKARHFLAGIWFLGALFPFTLIVAQTILGRHGNTIQEVWAWFVPTILPTLSLMLGVIGSSALIPERDTRRVKPFFFRLSVGLSLTYITILSATLLLEPFSPTGGIKLYGISNYWLSPIQSLALGTMTVLFTSFDAKKNEKSDLV